MKKLTKTFLLISTCLLFIACENCKTCEYTITWNWSEGMTATEIADSDAVYVTMGYADTQDYYDSLYPAIAGEEYCDDELDIIEATADIDVAGVYSAGYTCE